MKYQKNVAKKTKISKIMLIYLGTIIILICILLGFLFKNKVSLTANEESSNFGIESSISKSSISNSNPCFGLHDVNLFIKNSKMISFKNLPILESGIAKAGQVIAYSFEGRSGQKLSYQTTDNICIVLYSPEQEILTDYELPKDGKYSILVSTPQGSTTFDLELILDTSQNKLAKPNPSPSTSAYIQKSTNSSDSQWGHLSYLEASATNMIIIASYAQHEYQRFELLYKDAAQSLMKMIYAARDEGVWIVPVSGFRTIERQKLLFSEQIERLGSIEEAAKVSAPPGYSEHHTGYAIDLTDGNFPKQDITNSFINTAAFQWLTLHAKEYGFEMSFPLNNSQGVMFEPWHWRFVGSSSAATIFSKVTNSK
jgi:D-alanyl-D-alanine carboxypeptidase